MPFFHRDERIHRELKAARAELEKIDRHMREAGIHWETPEWKAANRKVDTLWRRSRWIDRIGTRAD